jgi:hypothetical protein
MTKIGFRIRSSEKYASIYVYFHNSENQKIERKTGFYTRSEFWSVYSQRSCCPTSGGRVNYLLDKLEDHLTKSYNLSRGSGLIAHGDWLEIQIAQVFNRKIKDKQDFILFQIDQFIQQAPFRVEGFGGEMGLKENTIRNYRGLKRILTAFENYRGAPILLSEINKEFVESLTGWMMSEMNYSINYTSNTLKLLKAICSEARKKGLKCIILLSILVVLISGKKTVIFRL